MGHRFDIVHVEGRELVLSDLGCERHGSLLVQATLSGFALKGRRKYRYFLLDFMNFEMNPGEPRWAFLFENPSDVRKRIIRWARESLRLTIASSGYNDGTFNVTREARFGPVNHFGRAFSVIRRLYLTAQGDDFRLRPIGNPLSVNRWDTWDYDRRYDWVVKRFGPKNAHYLVRSAGSFFSLKDTTTYLPPLVDPAGFGERMFEAMVDLLGDHAAADITGVLRDDGPRWSDVANATFADYAVSAFGRILLGENKGGLSDERGRRLPSKPVGLSEELRDRIHRRMDAQHALDPSLPDMKELRRLLATEGRKALRKWFVFAKPMTNEPYSYEGYRRLERKAMTKSGVTVVINGEEEPASSRWARRSLHEGEWLEIHETTTDPKEIARRERLLTLERGHRTDQHHNYASHGIHKLVTDAKAARQDKAAARRANRPDAAPVAPPVDRPALRRLHRGRQRSR